METIGRDLEEMQRTPLAAAHVDAMRSIGAEATYAAGAVLVRPGEAVDRFVYVLDGEIVMGVRGGQEVRLKPGQTFYEGPNDVHTVGRNASKTKPATFIVMLLKQQGVQPVLPAR